jgi:hypothetical protein
MKNKILVGSAVVFLAAASAQAASMSFSKAGFDLTVEPIVGYQFTHVDRPSFHGTSVLIYGARVTAGSKLLSGEAEYTRGNKTEVFASPTQTVKTDLENVKIGLRSTPPLTGWLSAVGRAGAQASRQKIETIQGSTSTVDDGKWDIDPYAGIGVQGALGSQFSLSAEATYVFNDLKDWSRNDVQTTLSLKIDLNAK